MICFKRAVLTGPVAALILAGCASTPDPSQTTLSEAEVAEAQALLPADAQSRAIADRSEPITRATFWAIEYEKTPENLETTLSYLDALQGISSHKKVVEVASAALPLHPVSDELLTVFGKSLMKIDRYEDAANAYKRASELNPQNVTAFSGLGTAYDRMELHKVAQPFYRQALALAPSKVSTRSNLGLSLALTGELDEAVEHLSIAADLPGANATVRQNLALVLGLKGDFEAARATAEVDAPTERVNANLDLLREVTSPTHSWEELEQLADAKVEADPKAPPAPQPVRTPTRRLRGGLSSSN